jgi:nucleotide-binding universal stress UspA family protein
MPIRKLLVPISGTAAGEAALSTALLAARIFNAHMQALHVQVDSRDVAPLAGEGLSGAMIEEMMTATEREGQQRGDAVRAVFDRFIAQHQVPEARPKEGERAATASFTNVVGREEDVVAQQARLADLTVVPHPEAADDVSSSDALHAVLFDSGRPVLIAPKASPRSIGARVCVAWNGTAESAAAMHAALPWLQRAEAVRVLHSEDYQRSAPPASALVDYLALYEVHPEVAAFRGKDRNGVGGGMLAAAREWGADLLAMGAYSHSRLRQLILGGVTRHVLEFSDLPVLMNR